MRTTGNTTRRLTAAAVSGVAVLAIVGGSALIAPAANASTVTTYRCATTSGGTALVDFGGADGGLIGLGSNGGGVVGVATGTDGVQIGLLHFAAVVGLGATPSTVLVGSPAPTAPSSPTTPTVPAPAEPTTGATPGATPTSTPASTVTTPPGSTSLAGIRVGSSATTVYPAEDGHKDSVTFSIRGMTTSATSVPITGPAVLRRGGTVIRTWKIDGDTSMLTWNGRVGSRVRAGFYTLTVIARSADGVRRTTTTKIRVSAKHLEQRTVVVRSTEIAHRTTAIRRRRC